MTRYFYTDPLAACWMAKHHGILFEMPDGNPPGDYDALCLLASIGQSRYTVHPDSLDHFTPRTNDLVEVEYDEHQWHVIRVATPEWYRRGKLSSYRIIQRNGISFMWPESEA